MVIVLQEQSLQRHLLGLGLLTAAGHTCWSHLLVTAATHSCWSLVSPLLFHKIYTCIRLSVSAGALWVCDNGAVRVPCAWCGCRQCVAGGCHPSVCLVRSQAMRGWWVPSFCVPGAVAGNAWLVGAILLPLVRIACFLESAPVTQLSAQAPTLQCTPRGSVAAAAGAAACPAAASVLESAGSPATSPSAKSTAGVTSAVPTAPQDPGIIVTLSGSTIIIERPLDTSVCPMDLPSGASVHAAGPSTAPPGASPATPTDTPPGADSGKQVALSHTQAPAGHWFLAV